MLDLTLVDPPASAPLSENFRSTSAVGLADGLLITADPARHSMILGAEEAAAGSTPTSWVGCCHAM